MLFVVFLVCGFMFFVADRVICSSCTLFFIVLKRSRTQNKEQQQTNDKHMETRTTHSVPTTRTQNTIKTKNTISRNKTKHNIKTILKKSTFNVVRGLSCLLFSCSLLLIVFFVLNYGCLVWWVVTSSVRVFVILVPFLNLCLFSFNLIDSTKNQINDKGQRTNTTNDKDKEEEHRTLYQHPEQRIISETNNSFKKPQAAKNNNKNVEDM